jgi:hypothetical protein
VARSYIEDSCGDQVSSVEFCTGVCEQRTWTREADESSVLEAVARERVMKTQQAGKTFSVRYGDLWIVKISGGDVTACSSDSCVWLVNKSIHQSKLRL